MAVVEEDVRGNPLDVSYHLDGYHKQLLDESNELVEDDWDVVLLLRGMEGAGKSTFAKLSCYYLDNDFDIDNIVFTAKQFSKAVDEADQYSAILWDEADQLSAHHMDKVKKSISSKMKRIRQKNLFIWLVSPDVWQFGKYFFIHRTMGLIDVYAESTEDGLERGYWRFWNRERKKNLYFKGKRYNDIDAVAPKRIGKFIDLPDGFPIDEEEYREKKSSATRQFMNKKKSPGTIRKELRMHAVKTFYDEDFDLTQTDVGKMLDVDRSYISRLKGELKEEGKL
jgi:hypothetical protein